MAARSLHSRAATAAMPCDSRPMRRLLPTCLALLACAVSAQAADGLPKLKILPGSLTVSGFSSGGYMATQYQVAYSKDVIGAGIVGAAVVDSLLRFYHRYLPPERIHYETQVDAAHGFPTDDRGGDCGIAQSPWIIDCGYDAAGNMLSHFYDGLRKPSGAVAGELRIFDQLRYAREGMLTSLADEGYLFVPADCAAGKPCP